MPPGRQQSWAMRSCRANARESPTSARYPIRSVPSGNELVRAARLFHDHSGDVKKRYHERPPFRNERLVFRHFGKDGRDFIPFLPFRTEDRSSNVPAPRQADRAAKMLASFAYLLACLLATFAMKHL